MPDSTPHTDRFLNRELSWLAFNSRVLEEAGNPDYPLLERLRFLAISHNNLEEFYTVRVAGLKAYVEAEMDKISMDGLTPTEQLHAIYKKTRTIITTQQEHWNTLVDALTNEGLHLVKPGTLDKKLKKTIEQYFLEHIFPILAPMALDPSRPFPFIPNEGLALALEMTDDQHTYRTIVMIPRDIPRFIALGGLDYILLEDVLRHCLPILFPGRTLKGYGLFQVLRDSELEVNDEAEDLMRSFESALKQRRRGNVIQLMAQHDIPKRLLKMIVREYELTDDDVFLVDGLVALSDAAQLVGASLPDLRFPKHYPRYPERIKEFNGDCLAAIRAKDILIHHPFESFDVVVQFLEQVAEDPDVISIRQTLYRTGHNSPIVKALIRAAENGKHVTAVVELKARFDEAANLEWSKHLERAGVQVVFGFLNKKTHAKISLVVRREDHGLRSYVHFGTGNYHQITAKVYTDLSYFTCDPALVHDAIRVFNHVAGYAPPEPLKKLFIAPTGLRRKLLALIEQETDNAKNNKPASIWVKSNSLVDPVLIDALYQASGAGVQIDLVIRGICCLKPGVPGLSENIRVKSIVGRFLEHARIFCFGNGTVLPSPEAKVYMSSADWMQRNCDWRVETMVPIENPTVHQQIIEQVMAANLKDNTNSWVLDADGQYTRVMNDDAPFSAHEYFMTNPSLSGQGTVKPELPSLLNKPIA